MRKSWKLVIVPVLALMASSPAGAAITNYYGLDVGAGPASPLPNSNAQAAAFDTAAGALGSLNLITFESLPVSLPAYNSSLSLGGGVTALLTGAFTHGTTGIGSTPGNLNYGFNVTAGGSKYLELDINMAASPASVTINFPSPVQAFGAYVGGVGTGGVLSSLVAKYNDIRYVVTGGAAPSEPSAIPALSRWGLAVMTVVMAGIATAALKARCQA